MPIPVRSKRFLFRGNASGLAAHIRRPKDIVVPVPAASSLPIIGGQSHGIAKPSKFPEIMSWASCETHAIGDFTDHKKAAALTENRERDPQTGELLENADIDSRTMVCARATIVHLLKRVTVDVVEAAIVCDGYANVEPSIRLVEPPRFAGMIASGQYGEEEEEEYPEKDEEYPDPDSKRQGSPRIEGLQVDGMPLRVTIHEEFSRLDTFQKVKGAYECDDQFLGRFDHCFFSDAGQKISPGDRKLPESNGVVQCTIVDRIEWVNEEDREADKRRDKKIIRGNQLHIPDYGVIFLGEVFITPRSRRLSMMRFVLGSPFGGEAEMVTMDSDPRDWP